MGRRKGLCTFGALGFEENSILSQGFELLDLWRWEGWNGFWVVGVGVLGGR